MLRLVCVLLLLVSQPPPPRTAPPIGGRVPIADPVGFVTPNNRPVRNPALAVEPVRGHLAVAWIAWGANLADHYAGDVWVRVQGASGSWQNAQTLNLAPVRAYFGGIVATWTPSGTLAVAFGDGRGGVWLRESADAGATWNAPERIGSGQIGALAADEQGTLHALILAGRQVVQGVPRYGTRNPGGVWTWSTLPTTTSYNGQLALLPLPDGRLRRFVLANGLGRDRLGLWFSDDGQRWSEVALPLDQYLPRPERPTATSLLAAQRPDGTGVVAVAWSQPAGPGPVAGGLFAAVSLDAGATWGDEEVVAQHRTDGSFGDARGGTVGAFEPSLTYSRELDQLAVSWVEDDLRQAGRAASATNRMVRTRLSARALTPDVSSWQFAVTPTTEDPLGPPLLSGWGLRAHLWGDTSGAQHWLLTVDERNMQARISIQQIDLPGLLVLVPS